MVNLVGDEDHTGNVYYKNIDFLYAEEGVTPYIYGKKETRPFRKMGHVTVAANTKDELQQKIQTIKKSIRIS